MFNRLMDPANPRPSPMRSSVKDSTVAIIGKRLFACRAAVNQSGVKSSFVRGIAKALLLRQTFEKHIDVCHARQFTGALDSYHPDDSCGN